jgi:hypothetical protein
MSGSGGAPLQLAAAFALLTPIPAAELIGRAQ